MLRRDFLRRLTTTAAGLLVADDALELLSHRKVWAGHDFTPVFNREPMWYPRWSPVRTYGRIAVDNYESFTVAELQKHWRKLRTTYA